IQELARGWRRWRPARTAPADSPLVPVWPLALPSGSVDVHPRPEHRLPPPPRTALAQPGASLEGRGPGRGLGGARPGGIVAPGDGGYQLPPPELLEPPAPFAIQDHETKVQERAMILEKTLREHGCIVRVVQIDTGPVITQFEIELEAGLRVSRVVGLSN